MRALFLRAPLICPSHNLLDPFRKRQYLSAEFPNPYGLVDKMDVLLGILKDVGVNQTIWCQFSIFIFTYIVLFFLLFRPYHRALVEREKRTQGGSDLAQKLQEDTQKLETVYSQKARELSEQQKRIYDRARKEMQEEQASILQTARDQAKILVDKNRLALATEVQKIRSEISNLTPAISETIVERLLTRGQ